LLELRKDWIFYLATSWGSAPSALQVLAGELRRQRDRHGWVKSWPNRAPATSLRLAVCSVRSYNMPTCEAPVPFTYRRLPCWTYRKHGLPKKELVNNGSWHPFLAIRQLGQNWFTVRNKNTKGQPPLV